MFIKIQTPISHIYGYQSDLFTVLKRVCQQTIPGILVQSPVGFHEAPWVWNSWWLMLHHATPSFYSSASQLLGQNSRKPIYHTTHQSLRPVEDPLHLPQFCLDEIKVHVFPLKIAYLAAPKFPHSKRISEPKMSLGFSLRWTQPRFRLSQKRGKENHKHFIGSSWRLETI